MTLPLSDLPVDHDEHLITLQQAAQKAPQFFALREAGVDQAPLARAGLPVGLYRTATSLVF